MKLQGEYGPGPGFMAFIVGVALASASLVWGIRTAMAPGVSFREELLPDREGLVKLLATIAALGLFAALLTPFGRSIGNPASAGRTGGVAPGSCECE